ncbi:hypothetical protein Ciccas_002946 [Cichlidogyrus casuarinus]|uniref:Uncharacterized protein n=1 Tax=Cichlidogyrus casuarinus TaxID=1844966 RepID=A0ABD2QFS1_9PLAT
MTFSICPTFSLYSPHRDLTPSTMEVLAPDCANQLVDASDATPVMSLRNLHRSNSSFSIVSGLPTLQY